MFGRKKNCPHSNLRGIYGDEICHTHSRLQCRSCGRYIDGPVELAEVRKAEWELFI